MCYCSQHLAMSFGGLAHIIGTYACSDSIYLTAISLSNYFLANLEGLVFGLSVWMDGWNTCIEAKFRNQILAEELLTRSRRLCMSLHPNGKTSRQTRILGYVRFPHSILLVL